MPYRLNPTDKKVVQVMRNGRWQKFKSHPTVARAKAHLVALNKNVKHK